MDMSSAKRFGCIKIDWLIENICLQTVNKDWCIRSPEFIVHVPKETKWSMILRPISCTTNSKVSFILKRSSRDTASETVWVNLRLGFLASLNNKDTKVWNEQDCTFSLSKGEAYEKLLKRLSKMNFIFYDLLTITCKMIVYDKITPQRFADCGHCGIKLLSEDLLNLYEHGNDYDVLLKVGKKVGIPAHEAILCSRNETICDLIKNEVNEFHDEYSILRLPGCFNREELQKVLAYLYSGNLKHVLEEPSHGIYDWALFLNISDISNYYVPGELILKSCIDVELFTIALNSSDCHGSYEERNCEIEFSKRISHYTNELFVCNIINANTVHFSFESSEEIHLKSACLEIFVDLSGRLEPMGKFLYPISSDFMLKKFVLDLTGHLNSNYRLIIKLRVSCMIQNSVIVNQRSLFKNCLDQEECYKLLSFHLEDLFLFNEGEYETVSLISNNGALFRVHRCILASRSVFFKNLFQETDDEDIFLSNIDSSVLCMVLIYFYSGSLTESIMYRDEKLPGVYKGAVEMNIPTLKMMCSEALKLCFKTNLNIRCRAMKLAEEYQDISLKKYFLNHLFSTVTANPVFSRLHTFRDVPVCTHCAK